MPVTVVTWRASAPMLSPRLPVVAASLRRLNTERRSSATTLVISRRNSPNSSAWVALVADSSRSSTM